MSEMIERMAKAMCDAHIPGSWQTAEWPQRHHYIDQARAAIEAIREPTQAMIAAACDDFDKRGRGQQSYTHIWQAMIDEALK
jgi:hypothetical protein